MSDVQAAPAEAPSVPGLIPPTERTGAKRRIGDVIVQLGFTDREVGGGLGRQRARARTAAGAGADRRRRGQLEPARPGARRAQRTGLRRPERVRGRPRRGSPGGPGARRAAAAPSRSPSRATARCSWPRPTRRTWWRSTTSRWPPATRSGGPWPRPRTSTSVIAALSRLDESVQEMDEVEEEDPAQVIELRESADDAPVVKLVHTVIADAVSRGASDIHFEPRQGDMRVRFRIDGVVSDSTTVPRHLVAGLVSRVKIMSDLNIAERRAPQDGRVGLTVDGRRIDLRVATLPVMRGEAVVMRILDAGQSMTTIDALGMGAHDRTLFEKSLLGKTHGAILVTGPTGSGKTTTLYAGLGALNTPDKTIVTIEDPVEYELEGIKQVQVNTEGGTQLPGRPALHGPGRPRRDHGRRDPRPRDRSDRDRVRAHRPPGPQHPAHERRSDGRGTADRDGDRALPRRLRARVRGGSAAGAAALRLQDAGGAQQGGAGIERIRRQGRARCRHSSPASACAAAAPATRAASASIR